MTHQPDSVTRHYTVGGIMDKIESGLQQIGKDTDSITVDDLSAVDAFHTRGRESTVELATLAELQPQDRVLDVGCGLGGSARFLANKYGCHVTALDLTPEYIEVATELSRLTDMQERTAFETGDATALPFADDTFDVVWTEHAQMNIADKDKFYAEIARVLRPGGRLVFHDIFAASGDPDFPVPWAEDASISQLVSEDDARHSIERSGLAITLWDNKVAESIAWFETTLAKIQSSGPPPIGIHLLMGDTARTKLANYLNGLNGGKLSVVIGVATK
ncbi:MAG: class I SAM-dependent methyltransferase [Pirellulaceae bacterium]